MFEGCSKVVRRMLKIKACVSNLSTPFCQFNSSWQKVKGSTASAASMKLDMGRVDSGLKCKKLFFLKVHRVITVTEKGFINYIYISTKYSKF